MSLKLPVTFSHQHKWLWLSPPSFGHFLFVCNVKDLFQCWLSDLSTIENVESCFLGGENPLCLWKVGKFLVVFSGVPDYLFRALPLSLIDWNLLATRAMAHYAQTMKGALERCGNVKKGVSLLFPRSFCLRHRPLTRVNENKLVWV